MSTNRGRDPLNVGQPYNDAWKHAGVSEQSKYEAIEQTCNEHRQWLLRAAPIILEAESRTTDKGPWDQLDPRTVFKMVADSTRSFLHSERISDDEYQRYRFWREADALFRRRMIRLHQDMPETVPLRESLTDSRFYCEYRKGTHIFHYTPPREHVAGQSHAEFSMLDNGTVHFFDPPPPRDLSAPAQRSSFTYCGQVPRPAKEYTMRLNTILPQIFDVIVCVIVWEGRARRIPEANLAWLSSGRPSAMQALLRVVAYWDMVFGKGRNAPKRVLDQLKENRVLTEAAYLVLKLKMNPLPHVLEANLDIIAEMITRTTAMSIEAAAELEGVAVRLQAFDELFDRGSTPDCFIWGNQDSTFIVNNIHEHYRQDEFQSDPLSVQRADLPDCAWDAAQGLVRLVPSLSPEFLPPGSRLRTLQPAPDFPLELTTSYTPRGAALSSRNTALASLFADPSSPSSNTTETTETTETAETTEEESASPADIESEPRTPASSAIRQSIDPKAN